MTIFGFGASSTKFQLSALEWKKSTIASLGSSWKATDDSFTSDATVSENYQLTSEISKFPVQSGYPTTDMGGTTSFSVIINAVNSNSTGGLLDTLSDPIQAFSNSPLGSLFGAETSVQKAYNKLEEWSVRGTPLELRCVYAKDGYKEAKGKLAANGKIAPFLISSLSIIRNQDTGDSIGYTCILERVFISEAVRLVEQGVIDTTNKGALGVNEATPSEKKKGKGKFNALGELDQSDVQSDSGKMETWYLKAKDAAADFIPQ